MASNGPQNGKVVDVLVVVLVVDVVVLVVEVVTVYDSPNHRSLAH